MKFFAIAALFPAGEARHHCHPHNIEAVQISGVLPKVCLGHDVIIATREDFDNSKGVWGED